MTGGTTVREALAAFRRENGLRHDEAGRRLWLLEIGGWTWPLPNFAWRRRAIDAHDVHHLLTGYPCTAAGEFEIAAWEWGAGRYPHWGATFLCFPFVLFGLATIPARTVRAFRQGRRSRSLYAAEILPGLLDMDIASARRFVAGGG